MAANKKITVQSILDSTLWHNDVVVEAHEIVLLDEACATELIKKGFCKAITVKEK